MDDNYSIRNEEKHYSHSTNVNDTLATISQVVNSKDGNSTLGKDEHFPKLLRKTTLEDLPTEIFGKGEFWTQLWWENLGKYVGKHYLWVSQFLLPTV